MIKEIQYEYHDGWIDSVSIGPRKEVTIGVCLDTVWNPGTDHAEIRFGGIYNYECVSKYFERIEKDTSDIDGGFEVNALHYDRKASSKPGDLNVFLDVETVGHIRIHCKNMTEMKTDNKGSLPDGRPWALVKYDQNENTWTILPDCNSRFI